MRWPALAALVVATGCNQIFGLDPTIAIDAAPPEQLPPGPRTKLVWAIATTDGDPQAPGVDPVVVYQPIGSESLRPDVPTILVGDDSGLSPAIYDVSDGSFEIPYPLRESPHRIVYTLPGESVPHEVQWSLTGALLTVPRTTRADAPRAPDSSGYTITPINSPGGFSDLALFTSGVFTADADLADFEQSSSAVTFRYSAKARPLAGPLGAPQIAKGDWILLMASVSHGTYKSSDGWALTQLDLAAGMISTPTTEPAWMTTQRTLSTLSCPGPDCLPLGNFADVGMRLDQVLGTLGTSDSAVMWYGVSPCTQLAGFVPGPAPTYLDQPLVLPFMEASALLSTFSLADPSGSLALDRVVAARVASARTVGGVTLTSAISTVTSTFSGKMQYPAPLVQNIMLGTTNLSADQPDNVVVPASSSLQKLKFVTEAGYAANDFVVTLYEINGMSLAPVRVFHVIAPEVKIDGSLLASGHTYVFGITARAGFGGADRGDYAKATYPFGSSTTFPRTFTVQ